MKNNLSRFCNHTVLMQKPLQWLNVFLF